MAWIRPCKPPTKFWVDSGRLSGLTGADATSAFRQRRPRLHGGLASAPVACRPQTPTLRARINVVLSRTKKTKYRYTTHAHAPFDGHEAWRQDILTQKCVQWRIQKIVLRGAKGVWDAVDTSPDFGGQNVLKT